MAVILIFLVLGAVIIFFFGEVMFTVAAVALLTAFLVCRLDLSGTWVDRAWIFVTAPPISVPAFVLWIGYFALGALLLWALNGKWLSQLPPQDVTPGPRATASETPAMVDMASLERELFEGFGTAP